MNAAELLALAQKMTNHALIGALRLAREAHA